jgi:sterol desaturase/sphingolipid hydroxylase (fatty acid hydroxylase superfamily)
MRNKPLNEKLLHELEASRDVRKFGSGWLSGILALVAACASILMVISFLFPGAFNTPELQKAHDSGVLRIAVHVMLIASFLLAMLNLILRPSKVLGLTAMALTLVAALLGGSKAQALVADQSNLFFGLDFFVLNVLFTGFLFIPVERLKPHRTEQTLFRGEWREDLFYYLISSMMVQVLTFLSFAPSNYLNANVDIGAFRAWVGALPLVVQIISIMILTDFMQYWFHRAFHKVPFLWGFHAVHHSAKSMDWMAGARMHFFEIIALRGVTAIPMMTLGFTSQALQIYILLVYVYSSLLHANIGWNFGWLEKLLATPRFHHWHHGLEQEAIDVNFAIHFPFLDRIFGTHHMPENRWPKDYGVPEQVPNGYLAQFKYPFVRKQPAKIATP